MIKENGKRAFDIAFNTVQGKSRFETVKVISGSELQNELGYMRFQTKDGRTISVDPKNTLALNIKGQFYKIRS